MIAGYQRLIASIDERLEARQAERRRPDPPPLPSDDELALIGDALSALRDANDSAGIARIDPAHLAAWMASVGPSSDLAGWVVSALRRELAGIYLAPTSIGWRPIGELLGGAHEPVVVIDRHGDILRIGHRAERSNDRWSLHQSDPLREERHV